jgi:hypothetical protein
MTNELLKDILYRKCTSEKNLSGQQGSYSTQCRGLYARGLGSKTGAAIVFLNADITPSVFFGEAL